MMNAVRERLGARLLVSYLAVIMVGGLVLLGTVWFTSPAAYERHLARLDTGAGTGESQDGASQSGAGLRRGQGGGYGGEMYASFQDTLREALGWAGLTALASAFGASLLVSRRVVRPVQELTGASGRIAAGNFEERVQETSKDEIGQLARSFNRMAARLQQAENLRRQLIGDVAHELRTPLTTIKGSVEAMIDGKLPAGPETFRLIYSEAERLNRLVDDLQELSRVEAGAYELQPRKTALPALVRAAQARFANQFHEKSVRLQVDLPEGLPEACVDGDRILQVLANLLANSLRYTPAGGQVTMRMASVGDLIQVTVADTGAGIPAEHLEHVFTRFYRVDKSRSRQAGGSGIGLTIARHLVEAHGGRIWVESRGRGQGSAFHFTVPASPA